MGIPEPNLRLSSRLFIAIEMPSASVGRSIPMFHCRFSNNGSKRINCLAYDRRTGDFFIPGKGKVFLYDRGDKPSPTEDTSTEASDGSDTGRDSSPVQGQRTVTQTSARAPATKARVLTHEQRERLTCAESGPQQPNSELTVGESPTMVLTQIHFNNGMRGRLGSGKENDKIRAALVGILRQRRGVQSQGPEREVKAQSRSLAHRWGILDGPDTTGHSGTATRGFTGIFPGQAIPQGVGEGPGN